MDEEGGNDDIKDADDKKGDHHYNCNWKTIIITIATEKQSSSQLQLVKTTS